MLGDPDKEGPALQVSVNPYALALHGDKVLVADPANSVVRSLDLDTRTFTTFAGQGGGQHPADLGDGQPARSVQIGGPVSLAVAGDGAVYLGDSGFTANRVRRVAPDGTIAVVAGTGVQAFGGDGGPARAADVYGPTGLAVAPDGALWISDTYNNRIRRIDASGVIDTVVGTGDKGFAGDGGAASAAMLDTPKGLAFTSAGALLIADSGNNRIRQLSPDGVITTVAGSGPSGGSTFGDGSGSLGDGGAATDALLHAPSAARPTADGGFVIADTLNHKIRRVSPDGTISTIAGGGTRNYGTDGVPAIETNLFAPEDVLELPDRRIVIADTRASRVRVVGTDGIITAVAGNYVETYSGDGGPGTSAQSIGPRHLAVAPDGDLYFLDHWDNWVVRRLDAQDGTAHPVAGYASSRDVPRDGDAAMTASMHGAKAVTVAPDGAVLVAEDTLVRRIDPVALTQHVWAGDVTAGDTGDGLDRLLARFSRIAGIRALSTGDVLVIDEGAHRVRLIDTNGIVSTVAGTGVPGFSGDGGPGINAQLNRPLDAARGPDGTLYIADEQNGKLRAVSPDGTIGTVAGSGPLGYTDKRVPGPALEADIRPSSLTVLHDGTVLMTDSFAASVLAYRDGYVWRAAGNGRSGLREGDAATAMFSLPEGLALDPSGERVYIGDRGNQRLRAIAVAALAPGPTDEAPQRADGVTRFAGPDRFSTAAAISRGSFPTTTEDVFIVTGGNWPDALAAGPAAASRHAPVLPVQARAIPQVISEEITRLQPRRAWIIGGASAIADDVLSHLRARGIDARRISGSDRYSTAAAVARTFLPQATGAYYASGQTYADALAGGAAAAHRRWPLLLTASDALPPSTPVVAGDRIVLGGTAVVSDRVRNQLDARRLSGADRYATGAAVALDAFPQARVTYLATGVNFPDALAGAAAAARDSAPLLLATGRCVTTTTSDAISLLGSTSRVVLGGTAAVSDAAANLHVC